MKIELLESRDGNLVYRVNQVLLHSKYKPIEQAKTKAQQVYKEKYVHVVFGYGNGYLIDALINQFKNNETLIIVDPLISQGVIEPELKYDNEYIFLHNDFEKMKDFISAIPILERNYQYNIVCSFNYEQLFSKEYKLFLEVIRDLQQKMIVNDNTILLRSKNWQENFINNLDSLNKDCSISKLYKLYSCPVVVASGGPSLTKQLPLLKKFRDNLILVAAGSTINSLLLHEIVPDFVVSIDGSSENGKQFETMNNEECTLIYSYFHYSGINEKFKKAYFFANSYESRNRIFLQNLFEEEIPVLLGGGSVAHYALSFAQYITTSNVAMIGQDLAFTNNLKHAEGNKQQSNFNADNIKYVELEGYYDDKVKSDASFNAMKLAFEDLIVLLEDKGKIYNCTEGGVKIKGIQQLPFQEFLDSYALSSKNPVVIADSKRENKISSEKLEQQITLCEKISDLLEDGIKKLNNNKSSISFDTKTLRILDKIDSTIVDNKDLLPIEYIMQLIYIILSKKKIESPENTTSKEFRKKKKENEDTYKEIQKAINFYYKKLLDMQKKGQGK